MEGKPGLIIGDDLVEDFRSWHDVEQLVEMVDLIVAHRQSTENLEIGYPCRYVDNSLFPVSSSQIRRILGAPGCPAERDAVRDWLPPEVNEYIRRHDLYS
jgi:nicotinate-nucleotide adenylyltransferase